MPASIHLPHDTKRCRTGLPTRPGRLGRAILRSPGRLGRAVPLALLLACLAAGCGKKESGSSSSAADASSTATPVRVVRSELRSLTHTVGQPGFVDAYEQTAIYSKVSGFIQKFYVDIGDEIKKGQLLLVVFAPELEADYQKKKAQVALDEGLVQQAEQMVTAAQSHLDTATADVAEAQADLGKYQADVVRWQEEMKRVTRLVAQKLTTLDVLEETRRRYASTKAARDAAQATIAAKQAARASAAADLATAKIQVTTATAKVHVSKAAAIAAEAVQAYTKITAPYDGVVTVRNANTGDYVQAVSGERMSSGAVPIFVVARTDLVRIFVNIPEAYARYVHVGNKAFVRIGVTDHLDLIAAVTRTSWSLYTETRTLLAEVDLARKDYPGIRPGMYAYGQIAVHRPKVRTLPQQALTVQGNQTYCFLVEDGRAVKTAVQRGVTEQPWVEVLRKKVGEAWKDFTGSEEAIVGNLSEIVDGQKVRVAGQRQNSTNSRG